MSKRFNIQIKNNFREGFKTPALIDDLTALAVPVFYTIAPTIFGLNDWTAFLVGGFIPYVAGKAFNIPGMCHGALAVMGTHLMYAKLGGQAGPVQNLLGKPIWSLGGGQFGGTPALTPPSVIPSADTTIQPINGLNDPQYMGVNTPEQFVAYNPQEIQRQAYEPTAPQYTPEVKSDTSINDYIEAISRNTTLSDSGNVGWKSKRKGDINWKVNG